MEALVKTRAAMVQEVLPDYLAARAERLAAQRREEEIRKLLYSWLRANGEKELRDGETGVGVRIQEVQKAPSYDVVAIRQHDPALWQRCLDLGVVTLSHEAVVAQEKEGQIGGLDRYRIPGPVQERLVVVER